MLWRTVALSSGLVFALAVGCGGKAVVDGNNDDDGSGGSGGAVGQGGATNSSSSTGTPTCQGVQECCQAGCAKGASEGLACWPADCGCGNAQAATCEPLLEALWACTAVSNPFTYTCNGNALARNCGACDAEATAAAAANCWFGECI